MGAGTEMDRAMWATTIAGRTPVGMVSAEIEAYSAAAARGDVLPACMRLASARLDRTWSDRATMILAVGPACRAETLELACALMPRATEPRLLRAAATIRWACLCAGADRDLWRHRAAAELEECARLDPEDLTVRILQAELERVAPLRRAS